jgi:hypothetical protein
VLDQAEEVVDQVLVGDPGELGAVVALVAGIVENDRPEPLGEAVQGQRIASVGRRDAGDQDERRAGAEDPVGHPVPRALPGRHLGASVVGGHLGAKVGGCGTGGTRGRVRGTGS